MRILYLHPRAWSGEYPILKTLRDRGHQVCALEEWRGARRGARFFTDDFLEAGDRIPTLWYDPHLGWEKALTWPLDRFFKGAFSGRNLAHRLWLIRAAVRHFRPDVVACTDGFTYALPAAYLKRLGLLPARLLVSYIGGDILDCPAADYGRRRTPLVERMLRAALPGIDVFRPVSPLLAEVLRRDGAPPERITVVPSHLTADMARLRALDREALAAAVKARYGLPAQSRLLVTLSYNFRGKGLHLLAEQWRRIRAACPDARWLLCGPESSWLAERVRPLLQASGELESVTFTGPLGGLAVYEHLAAGELHVSPTLCEGLNMVTVEAAAVGTPTISGDGAGIAAWLERFDAGAVVPSGDAAALGEAIIAALADPGRIGQWRAGCAAMTNEFSLERIAGSLEKLMEPPDGRH